MIFTLARLVTACDDSKLIRIEVMNIRSNHFRVGGKHFDPISLLKWIQHGDLSGQHDPNGSNLAAQIGTP